MIIRIAYLAQAIAADVGIWRDNRVHAGMIAAFTDAERFIVRSGIRWANFLRTDDFCQWWCLGHQFVHDSGNNRAGCLQLKQHAF
ncbi:hypothetical protein EsCd1HHP024_02502 [Escherichia sp. HH091_1A]|nr:hypothetical protein EsCd1HHP024_02502 [Escherichia sp. HH091_1A]